MPKQPIIYSCVQPAEGKVRFALSKRIDDRRTYWDVTYNFDVVWGMDLTPDDGTNGHHAISCLSRRRRGFRPSGLERVVCPARFLVLGRLD